MRFSPFSSFSFPKLAKRFGNAHPAETPSPLHLTTTSNAVPMLTRLPPKRSFASPIRSQSALLTLGTRAKKGSRIFDADTARHGGHPAAADAALSRNVA
jgi:hypothetical protein